MAKKAGSTTFTKTEKQLLIGLINEYSLFNATDVEIKNLIEMRLGGRGISQMTIRRLKKEALEKNESAVLWLDRYCKGKMIDYYLKRIRNLETVENYLMRDFIEEASKPSKSEKKEDRRNKYLMDKLAKTIGENSDRLANMGMSPPVLAKLHSIIPKEILEGGRNLDPIHLEKYLRDFDSTQQDTKAIPEPDDKENVENKENESFRRTAEANNGDDNEIDPLSAETAIPPAIDKKNDTGPDGGTPSETATAQGDQPIF